VDGSGNVCVGGYFTGEVDFDPGPGQTIRSGGWMFLSKFDSSGNFVWSYTPSGDGSGTCRSLVVDSDGNLFAAGSYFGTIDFDPGAGTDEHTAAYEDGFLVKLDKSGQYLWAQTWGGPGLDRGYGVTVGPSGDLYVVGQFDSTCQFGDFSVTSNGDLDAFLCSFSQTGDIQWVRTWGGAHSDDASEVVAAPSGYLYIAGDFHGVVDFDPGPGEDVLFGTDFRASGYLLKLLSTGYMY
jgi:hypothetical protein